MNCEICGSVIHGHPKRIVIEGSRLVVCPECSGLGEPDLKPKAETSTVKPEPVRTLAPVKIGSSRLPKEFEELEIVEDFPKRIREAREERGMSQKDLAETVKERLSIIQKLELGKMVPDMKLARILEHTLKIKLLTPRKEPEIVDVGEANYELTLGDVIQYRKKD
ncbi:MAG: multiprotein bridging factor aMBF1 [Candidatus Bathyarchaeia archaeon]